MILPDCCRTMTFRASRAEEHAIQVHVQHGTPVSGRVLVQQQGPRAGDPGIAEQDVQPAQNLHGARHHRRDLGLDGDVTADRRTAAAPAPGHLRDRHTDAGDRQRHGTTLRGFPP
jgi:hypothetical protein